MKVGSFYFGTAVKALENGRIGGYLVVFGSPEQRDLYNEYFTKDTEFGLDWYDRRPALYHHGLDSTIKGAPVGIIESLKMDDVGIWAEAQLNERNRYVEAISELVKKGALSWSSGTMPNLVEIEDGHIRKWPIMEGSLTPTPAEPRMTGIMNIKTLVTLLKEHSAKEAQGTDDNTTESNLKQMEEAEMSREELVQLIRELVAEYVAEMQEKGYDADKAEMEDEALGAVEGELPEEEMKSASIEDVEAKVEEILDRVLVRKIKQQVEQRDRRRAAARKSIDEGRKSAEKAAPAGDSKAGAFRSNGPSRVEVGENLKYAHLTAADMAMVAMALRSSLPDALRNRSTLGDIVSEPFARHLMAKAVQQAQSNPYKSAQANYALKASLPIKADELNASDIAGQGLEWVGEFYSTDLWEKERFERIYDRLVAKGMMVQQIPQGFDTAYFPTEGSDPVVYVSPEANDVDATGRPEVTTTVSPFGTGRVSVTPKELKAASSYTVILEEDSLIAIAPQVNRQINEKLMETRDQLMINGDTATAINTNINLIDGTPGTGLLTPYYIATNGFRKLPLVTNTDGSRDAGGTLNLEDYRLTLALLDATLRQYRDRMTFIIPPDVETASLAIPEIATDDVRRTNATITSGILQAVYGVEVLTSGFLPLANSAGKVPAAGGTLGSILLVYAPYWGFAYKRNITLETARDILSGSNVVVASMRAGMVARGNNAATISYNVGV